MLSRNKMSSYITLEHILKEILQVVKPQQHDWSTRYQVIEELRIVLESVESLRGNLCFHDSVTRLLFMLFKLANL
jgi:hypothetical protein